MSTAAPDIAARAPVGARGPWFSMWPDPGRLKQIADDAVSGKLKFAIAGTFGLANLSEAPRSDLARSGRTGRLEMRN